MTQSNACLHAAVILSIGDELTLGQNVDTNSAWLSARLVERGILTVYHKTVPDDLPSIVASLKEAAGAATLVLITGGLGPTKDDLTRQAMADAAGVRLEIHEPSSLHLEQFFRKIGRAMPEQNRVQALCPTGADMLENNCGTAPGIRMTLDKATLVVMPGVPHEMKAMFERHVLPLLKRQKGRVILTETVQTFGLGESVVGEKLGDLMTRGRNPQVGTTVSGGVVSVRIRSEFADADPASREMNSVVEDVAQRLGDAVFGLGATTLQDAVGSLLKTQGATVATVEGCTGGLLAKLMTGATGADTWFQGGWICSPSMKRHEWEIPAAILTPHGLVSKAAAKWLAEKARDKADADYGLGVTAMAAPGVGRPDVPEGTVWISLAKRGGRASAVELIRFPGDLELVRERAAKTALNLLRLALRK